VWWGLVPERLVREVREVRQVRLVQEVREVRQGRLIRRDPGIPGPGKAPAWPRLKERPAISISLGLFEDLDASQTPFLKSNVYCCITDFLKRVYRYI